LVIILAKSGSQRVPNKNHRTFINGESLFERAFRKVANSAWEPDILIASDYPNIVDPIPIRNRVFITEHPEVNETTTSETVMLDLLEDTGHEPDVVVLVQVDSPFFETLDLDRAIAKVQYTQVNSAFTASKFPRYTWNRYSTGTVSDDGTERLPTQERYIFKYIEAGSIYAMDYKLFIKQQSRFIQPCEIIEVDLRKVFEVDEMWQFRRAQLLAKGEE